MGDTGPPGEIRAAGAVLWRPGPAGTGVHVALVHRPRYDDWSFPKGKAQPGEHPLVNAVREVAEETGVRPVLGRPLGRTRYQARDRPKRVDYWAATPGPPQPAHGPGGLAGQDSPNGSAGIGGQNEVIRDDGQSIRDDEIDKLEWLPIGAAMQRLSYPYDTQILREFAAGPKNTVPYIFLRHASAGRKGGGPADDLLRPLDQAGAAQAAELAVLLACYGPARPVSSAAARCVESLLPYGFLAGLPVTADPAFAWGAGAGAAAYGTAASARLAGLLADDAATIVCGHGETLPALLAQACAHFGTPVPPDPSLDKGEFWVLHVAVAEEVSVAALERHSAAEP